MGKETMEKACLRNSSIELLRIVCILGIVIMHINGESLKTCVGTNFLWAQLENSLFNAGVSIFVLISGYYGIKRSVRRVYNLEFKVVFYSILSAILGFVFFHDSITVVLKSCIPVSTGKYWFITGYMLLMLFAPYVNATIDGMSKESYRYFLTLMFVLFSLLPTFLYYHVLGGWKESREYVVPLLFGSVYS